MVTDFLDSGFHRSDNFLRYHHTVALLFMRFNVRAYLELCRVSNLPTVWTNVLTALVVSRAGFSWQNFLLLSLSMSLFYSGGMCLNDLCDREIDRLKKPLRPLPSNRISIGKAYGFTGSVFSVALFLLLFLPFHEALYAGSLLLLVIVVYDLIHKEYPFSVFLMAGCRLLVFVVSGAAVTGSVGSNVLIAGLLQFVYILALSLVARHENFRPQGFGFPVIPWMLACICLIDGIVMAVLVSSMWVLTGFTGMILTRLAQRYVRGD